ncbi:MAG TPA: hypothetical protein VIN67_00665, partial [Desulfobaccales bacterium]
KPEDRRPKEGRNPKSEPEAALEGSKPIGRGSSRPSGFGLLSDFGPRISELAQTAVALDGLRGFGTLFLLSTF